MATVLITGGTGLIGKALTGALLDKGYNVIILTRNPQNQKVSHASLGYLKWDLTRQEIDPAAISRADYIIHLAGANIGEKRWTEKRKEEILRSRVDGSSLIIKGLKENENSVKAVISASGIGWYGPDPREGSRTGFVESNPPYPDFLGDTCRQWEESIEPVTQLGKRLVKLRTAIALSKKGSVLDRFQVPLNFGIATILGSGRQVLSWIHIDDLIRIYIQAIENENMNGAFNAVATPLSNKQFVLEFAGIKRKNFFIPIHVPSFLLKIVLGEMSIEVLKSATVSNEKIRKTGFTFLYPTAAAALHNLK